MTTRMTRFYEILPGALAWLTIALLIVLSWRMPYVAAVFAVLFDIYWLLKCIYLSLHMRAAFKEMKRNLKVDWFNRIKELKGGSGSPSWEDIYHLVIFPMYRESMMWRGKVSKACRAWIIRKINFL